MKNTEAFSKKGTQTSNPFKRNQIVSTAETKDQPTDRTVHQKVNALIWQIHDSNNEQKKKKDDDEIFTKKLEKKIKKELKSKLATADYMTNLEESYSINKSQNLSESYSITESRFSNSIHSSRRPKPRSVLKESEDKSLDRSVSFNC